MSFGQKPFDRLTFGLLTLVLYNLGLVIWSTDSWSRSLFLDVCAFFVQLGFNLSNGVTDTLDSSSILMYSKLHMSLYT